MPPVVIAAGIGAVGSLAAAKMSSDSAKKATAASSTANANALAFEREKLAKSQANYDQWNQMRTALLHRYGVDIAPQAPAGAGPAAGGAPSLAARRPVMTAQAPPVQPMTIGDMAQRPAAPTGDGVPELGSWSDWQKQGMA